MDTGPKWYITRGQQRIGPIDASQLKHMAMTQQLKPTEYVWKEGMAQWVQAQQVQDLFDVPPVTVPLEEVTVESATVSAPSSSAAGAPSFTPPPQADAKVAATPTSAPVVKPPAARRPVPVAATYAQPALASTGDVFIPLLGGLMLLATIFVPWGYLEEYAFGPKKTIFSWTVVKAHFSDGGNIVAALWLIASWVTGLLAVVLVPMTRGITRAGVCLIFGAVAAVLFVVYGFQGGFESSTYKSGNHSMEMALSIIGGIVLFFILMIVHVVRRTGSTIATRLAQAILCIALIITTSILLYSIFNASNSLWSQYNPRRIKAPWSSVLRSSLLIDSIATLLGAILLTISAFTGKQRGFFSFVGLALLYLGFLTSEILTLLGEVGATGKWGELTAGVNGILLVIGTAIVLGSGIVQLVTQVRGRR